MDTYGKRINIAYSWSKEIERSWSGTAYSIVKVFKKNGYDVNLINVNLSFFQKIIKKIYRIFRLDFIAYKYENKIFKKKILNQMINAPLFIFSILDLNVNVPIYVYQDMSFGYLYSLAKNDIKSYINSGFKYDIKQLKKITNYNDSLLSKITKIFTMGMFLKKFYDNNYGTEVSNKVVCIGGGYNFEFIDRNNIKKENSFLFVGKDFYRKAGDIVVKAFENISKDEPTLKLYIIGPTEKINFNNQKIIFLGNKSFNETREYFEKCKVFVMPSRFEAYGLAFIEALTCGDIIIGRNKYEMQYFINDDNGYYVDLSVDSVENAMRDAIKNDMLSKKVIFDRKMYLEKYSWDSVFKKIQQEFKN